MRVFKSAPNFNKQLVRNIGTVSLGKLLSVLIKFSLRVVVLRVLTKEDFGIISTISAFVTYFDFTSDLSTQALISRDMKAAPKNDLKIFNTYLSTKIVLSSCSLALFLLLAYILDYFQYGVAVLFVSINIVINSLANTPETMWQARGDFKKIAVLNVFTVLISSILAGVIILSLKSYTAFFLSILISSTIAFTVKNFFLISSVKLLNPFTNFDIKNSLKLIKEAWPIAIGSIFYLLCYRVDIIILEKLTPLKVVAEYNAAFTILDQIVEVVWVQFLVVFYPKMVEIYRDNPANLIQKIHTLIIILVPIVALATITSYYTASPLLSFVFGEKYSISGIYFTLLLPAQLFFVLFSLFFRAQIIAKNTKFFPVSAGVAVALNLTLNFYFVPTYQAKGAIYTTLLVSFFLAASNYLYTRKVFDNLV